VARGVVVTAGVALAAASAWWAGGVGGTKTAHAAMQPTADQDGDGLPDAIEVLLGCRADRGDTDLDGFRDAEEIARGSRPNRADSVPLDDVLSISMDAFQVGPEIHAVTAVYVPDGVLAGKKIAFGMAAGNRLLPVPLAWLAGGSPMHVAVAADGVGRIAVLDPIFDAQIVFARRGFSLYSTVAQSGGYLGAAAVNLVPVEQRVFQQVITGSLATELVGLGVGGVYRPLTGDPQGGEPGLGEICAQTTVIVGVINGIVTQEVCSADCIDGWDTFCAPGCAATVGSQIKTIDPAALIGD
jgi:hypothetical protein